MIGGITVAHGNPQTIWVPIVPATTIYVGGLACVDASALNEGIVMLPDSAGVADTDNQNYPHYVVIGTNRAVPLFDSTYKCEYITSPAAADPHDGASIEYVGVEGPYAKGDPIPMAKVACLDETTVLRAPLYNASVGTAPTEVTVTVASTTGLGCTTGAIDFTSVADSTAAIYCRTGANAGSYRHLDSASTTVHTWDWAMKNDIAVGDKFVAAPCRTHGLSTVMFDDTSASFIDVADAPVLAGTARWIIHVRRLDLSRAGEEFVEFVFDGVHFASYAERGAPA